MLDLKSANIIDQRPMTASDASRRKVSDFYGMTVMVDRRLPPGTILFVDPETGRELSRVSLT